MPKTELDTNYYAIHQNANGKFFIFSIGDYCNRQMYSSSISGYDTAEAAQDYLEKKIFTAVNKPCEIVPYEQLERICQGHHFANSTPEEKALTPPYVRICWSENSAFKEGEVMSIKSAQNRFYRVDLSNDRQPGTYDKTKFHIVLTKDNDVYEGRQDFGDGDGGIIDHVALYAQRDRSSEIAYGLYSETDAEQDKKELNQLVKDLWDAYDRDELLEKVRDADRSIRSGDLSGIKRLQTALDIYQKRVDSREDFFKKNGYALHITPGAASTLELDRPKSSLEEYSQQKMQRSVKRPGKSTAAIKLVATDHAEQNLEK